MVQPVQLGRVEELACGLVAHQGIVLPRIPQALHHVQVLLRQAVAHTVVVMLFAAVVAGAAVQPRGDHVPARTATTDVVQRCKLARYREGLAVAGRHRGHQADVRSGPGQGRKNGERLKAVEVVRAGALGDVHAVCHK